MLSSPFLSSQPPRLIPVNYRNFFRRLQRMSSELTPMVRIMKGFLVSCVLSCWWLVCVHTVYGSSCSQGANINAVFSAAASHKHQHMANTQFFIRCKNIPPYVPLNRHRYIPILAETTSFSIFNCVICYNRELERREVEQARLIL